MNSFAWKFALAVAVLLVALYLVVPPDRTKPAGNLPLVFKTEDYAIQVTPVAEGLSHPWSVAFLPGGDMLITERVGRLRLVHNGGSRVFPAFNRRRRKAYSTWLCIRNSARTDSFTSHIPNLPLPRP
jgi:glucose/arabinose dehydrogenase